MIPQAGVHVAVQHGGGSAAGVPGGLSGAQYAVLGGCVGLLVLIGLLGLLAGSGRRSGMASAAAARRLIGESGLRAAAGQLRPSLLGRGGAARLRAVPGPRAPSRQRGSRGSAPAAGGRRS